MKKIFLIGLFLIFFSGFSQETLIFKSGSRVFGSDNEKLNSEEIRNLFTNNPEALNLYNIGKTKQTAGNILLWGGITTLTAKLLHDLNTDTETTYTSGHYYGYGKTTSERINPTLYFVGGAMIVAAIPIKIGFSKKIKKAVSLHNEKYKNPETSFSIESTSFVTNSNGAGISITF